MTASPLIEIKGLRVTFHGDDGRTTHAVDRVDLSVANRKSVVIEGHSEVKDNILTNAESLGETIVVFLQYIATLINGGSTTLTDGFVRRLSGHLGRRRHQIVFP